MSCLSLREQPWKLEDNTEMNFDDKEIDADDMDRDTEDVLPTLEKKFNKPS
jgi:hypothetical protein